jgi:hypothetical protein
MYNDEQLAPNATPASSGTTGEEIDSAASASSSFVSLMDSEVFGLGRESLIDVNQLALAVLAQQQRYDETQPLIPNGYGGPGATQNRLHVLLLLAHNYNLVQSLALQ